MLNAYMNKSMSLIAFRSGTVNVCISKSGLDVIDKMDQV